MNYRFLQLSSLLTALLLPSCGQFSSNERSGGISGGGGYVISDSEAFLTYTATQLADAIEFMPSIQFTPLPQGWNQAQLAHIIKSVRQSPDASRWRDGKELMFDYGLDRGVPYIEALGPYFSTFGTQSADAFDDAAARNLKRRLYHEAMHLLGADEGQAHRNAMSMMRALERTSVTCTEFPQSSKSGTFTLWPGALSFQRADSHTVRAVSQEMRTSKNTTNRYSLPFKDNCQISIDPQLAHAHVLCAGVEPESEMSCSASLPLLDF